MTTTTDLLPPAMRVLLDAAPPIVDRLHAMFATRSLTDTPAGLAARVDIDTTYSTPSLALIVEAVDPTGYYDYGALVTITATSFDDRPPYLWVDDYRNQVATDDTDPDAVAALVFGILVDRLPDLTGEDHQ